MDVALGAPSKYRLVELALRSMIELERAQAGMDVEEEVFSDFSVALLRTSYQSADAGPIGLIDPSLYEPYERLLRTLDHSNIPQIDKIQNYIKQLSNDLSEVSKGNLAQMPQLMTACATLHRELLNDINAEEMLVVNEWPSTFRDTSAGVGAT
jgi:hypothetical protein